MSSQQEQQQPVFSCIQILYSTQTGRAKACARRTARILREQFSLFGIRGRVAVPTHQSIDQYQLYQKLLLQQHQQRNDNNGNNQNGNTSKTLYLFFISTTGEGEHCDSIQQTWKALLNKSLNANTHFASSIWFGLFCLGDRAYGDLFCAAGRKWAVRLLQLGATLHIPTIGYGDDGDGDAGVFTELDVWIQSVLLPFVGTSGGVKTTSDNDTVDSANVSTIVSTSPYQLQIETISTSTDDSTSQGYEEWRQPRFINSYRTFFAQVMCPATAYSYGLDRDKNDNSTNSCAVRRRQIQVQDSNGVETGVASTTICLGEPPLVGTIISNQRITAIDWEQQDTRHIPIRIDPSNNSFLPPLNTTSSANSASDAMASSVASLPYRAGDIATVVPRNSDEEVTAFLQVLPQKIQEMADAVLTIRQSSSSTPSSMTTDETNLRSINDTTAAMAVPWPERCTLRGWLTFCADIHTLPEREDLRALSRFCSPHHPHGRDQQAKLVGLSEPSESALYVDYIIREKRTWRDVLFDFDSIRYNQQLPQHATDGQQQQEDAQSPLTIVDLLTLLPPMRPRDFSLVSAPSTQHNTSDVNSSKSLLGGWDIELCVGVVQGKTRLGRRHYHGLCSTYLANLQPSHLVQLWIRPGSFGALPLEPKAGAVSTFETPVLCIAAGTGIAPMRSLLLEREAVRTSRSRQLMPNMVEFTGDGTSDPSDDTRDNALIFGCRKETADFYYHDDWERMVVGQNLQLWTAFSQDQDRKVYVQQVLETIHNQNEFSLVQHVVERVGGIYIAGNPKMARAVKDEIKEILAKEVGEKEATRWIKKLQRLGRFSVEAWS